MTKSRRLLLIAMILFIGSYFAYNYVYRDHRDIKSETSQIEIAAPYLQERFINNDGDDLLNSTITVLGQITLIEGSTITLDSKVHCSFDEAKLINWAVGNKIKIKGRCIGYDDLFEQVKLDKCTIIK